MKPLLLLTLTASLAGLSSAATIVQTETFSFVPNDSRALTFDRFDTTLGTLTSVTVSVDITKSGGRFEVDNDSETSGTINLTHAVIGSLSSSDVSLRKTGGGVVSVGQSGSITATSTLSGQSVSATTGDSNSTFNATGNTDYVLFEPTDVNVGDSGTIRSADLSDYEAVGISSYDITFNPLQTVSATGLSGLQQAFTVASVSGSVTVTYNYIAAVPEPGSALLGGIGVLLFFRRRR